MVFLTAVVRSNMFCDTHTNIEFLIQQHQKHNKIVMYNVAESAVEDLIETA